MMVLARVLLSRRRTFGGANFLENSQAGSDLLRKYVHIDCSVKEESSRFRVLLMLPCLVLNLGSSLPGEPQILF